MGYNDTNLDGKVDYGDDIDASIIEDLAMCDYNADGSLCALEV